MGVTVAAVVSCTCTIANQDQSHLGEMLLVVLLSVIGLGLLWYMCKKRQQQQLQELCDAVSQTVAYCPQGESITYPQRRMLPLEVAGSATTVQTVPSAPTQSLWEKCRQTHTQTHTH